MPDLLFTDPPYCSGGFQESGRAAGSIGTDAKIKPTIANDTLSTRGYQSLIRRAVHLSEAAACAIFTDWRMWVHLFDVVESCGFGVRSMVVWDKLSMGMGLGFRTQHELVLVATRATRLFSNRHGRGNVIGCKRTGNRHHPTEKPLAVLKHILDVFVTVGSVYDPFAGSGSILLACEEMGRTCYAMEIDPHYCQVIIDRWEQATGQTAVLLDTDAAA